MSNMKFSTLRAANLARIPLFKNAKGEAYHREDDGSDWSLNDWYTAVMGEAGELGNDLKKVRRGDYTLDEKRAKIGKEIADVIIYIDILALQVGLDLDAIICSKFNEVSRRVGVNVFINGIDNEVHDGVDAIEPAHL